MANNPVQIVLNDGDFIRPPDAGRMGAPKEFFANKDTEFRVHKEHIYSQVNDISHVISTSLFGPAAYVSVKL